MGNDPTLMGIPPELRNEIYYKLLTFPSHGGAAKGLTCWPLILCTSKQIYNEAKDILYDNEIEIGFAKFEGQPCTENVILRVNHGKLLNGLSAHTVQGAFLEWPEWLRRCRNIRVDIFMAYPPSAASYSEQYRRFKPANRHLYSLCCLLAPKNCLVSFKVDINPGEHEDAAKRVPSRTFWPLTKLGKRNCIHLDGIPEKINRYLDDAEQRGLIAQATDTLGLAVWVQQGSYMDWTEKPEVISEEMLNSHDYLDHEYDNRLVAAFQLPDEDIGNMKRRLREESLRIVRENREYFVEDLTGGS